MKNLEHLSLPDDVYYLIERRARVSGRSLADEAADMLSRSAAVEDREAKLLDDIRKERDEMARDGVFLTEDDILSAIEWGRE